MLKKISLISLMALTSSCANPTAAVESDVDRFKKEYPDQIVTFQGKNQTMRYAWSGDSKKRPLLFVHGSPGSWEGWAHFLVDEDLGKSFQIFAVDRPGYGGSEGGKTETSLAKQAEDVLEVLKFNESHLPAILVGHSYGGPVIAKAAMVGSDKVAGLVFVASSVSPDLEKTKWFQYPATWWPIRVLIPTDLRVCNEEIFPLKGELTKMLPDWKGVTAKTVIIQGDQDDLVPKANADFLVEHLGKEEILKVVRVPDLNHFVPWKRPDLIKDAIFVVDSGITVSRKANSEKEKQ